MRNIEKLCLMTGAFMLIVMAWALVNVLELRFSRGDLYQKYSSLRTDPFGAKALFMAYGICDGKKVLRNMRPLSELDSVAGTTLIIAGARQDLLDEPYNYKNVLHSFVMNGGRLIVLLMPDSGNLHSDQDGGKNKVKKKKKKKSLTEEKGDQSEMPDQVKKSWSDLKISKSEGFPGFPLTAVPGENFAGIFKNIPIYAGTYFETGDEKWETVFKCNDKPVLMERKFGRGTLVAGADSYVISNEYLSRNLDPAFISWLAGDSHTIIFDEYLNGMREEKNILWLAGKCKLWFFGFNLFILVAFMLWRNFLTASNAVLKTTNSDSNKIMSSYGSLKGLENLLKMSIGKDRILEACFDEWSKTAGQRNISPDTMRELKEMASKGSRTPVKTYNEMCELIHERSFGRKNERS